VVRYVRVPLPVASDISSPLGDNASLAYDHADARRRRD
jgi:hypothetical protein